MDNDFNKWINQIRKCDMNNFSYVLSNGFNYFQSLANFGELKGPFKEYTQSFIENQLHEIIYEIFECIKNNVGNYELFLSIIDFIIIFAIKSFKNEFNTRSNFKILLLIFDFDEQLKRFPVVDHIISVLMKETNNFVDITDFLYSSKVSLLDYVTIFLILYQIKISNNTISLNDMIDSISISFFDYLDVITNSEIQHFPLNNLIPLTQNFFYTFYNEELDGTEYYPYYNFLNKCIKCDSLEKKLFGVHSFVNIFNVGFSNINNNLMIWFSENDFFTDLIYSKPHIEVLKIISVLFEPISNNHLLKESLIYEIWAQSLAEQKVQRIIYNNIIASCLPSLNDSQLYQLFLKIIDRDNKNYDIFSILSFFKDVSIKTQYRYPKIFYHSIKNLNAFYREKTFKSIFLELLQNRHRKIVDFIFHSTSLWIQEKLFHPNIYEILRLFIKNSIHDNYGLQYDMNLLLNYIQSSIDYENSKLQSESNSVFVFESIDEVFNLLLVVVERYQLQLTPGYLTILYSITPPKQFWRFLFHYLMTIGIQKFSCNFEFLSEIRSNHTIQNEIINLPEEHVNFYILFYFLYSVNFDHSVIFFDQAPFQKKSFLNFFENFSTFLYDANFVLNSINSDLLKYLFVLYFLIDNDKLSQNINCFLMIMIQHSALQLNQLNQFVYYICVEFLNENKNDLTHYRAFSLLLYYIDTIEGRIEIESNESSKLIFKKMHESLKLNSITIPTPSNQQIKIKVSSHTTIFSLKNVLSGYFQIPIEYIHIQSKNLNDLNVNSLHYTYFNPAQSNENKSSLLGNIRILNPNDFLSNIIKNNVLQEFMNQFENNKLIKVLYKLLCRTSFDFIPSDILLNYQIFFSKYLENLDLNTPYHYLYMTERLKCFLKSSTTTNNSSNSSLLSIIHILLQCLISKRFEPKFLRISIIILCDYIKEIPSHDITCLKENVYCFLTMAAQNPKYADNYLTLISRILSCTNSLNDIDFDDISFDTIKALLLQSLNNETVFENFIAIIPLIKNDQIQSQIVDQFFNNPSIFVQSINRVIKISYQIFLNNNQIALNIFPFFQKTIFSNDVSNPSLLSMMCGILGCYTEIQELFDNFSSEINNIATFLLINFAFKIDNTILQKQIFDLIIKSKVDPTKYIIFLLSENFKEVLSIDDNSKLNFSLKNNNFNTCSNNFPFVSGLQNLGCTCYINSVLQQLFINDDLFQALIDDYNQQQSSIREDIQEIMKLYAFCKFGGELSYSTKDYFNQLCKYCHDLNERIQDDAVEYFYNVLNAMPKDCRNIFEGKITYKYMNCQNSHEQVLLSKNNESFFSIDLSVKNLKSLTSSLHQFLIPERMTGDNSYTLPSGEKVDTMRCTEFTVIPKYLVFHLKRFEYNLEQLTRFKVNDKFEFPTTLNMDNFSDGAGLYHLKGAVLHNGTVDNGHYTSVVRDNVSKKWTFCNDTHISFIEENEFLNMAYGNSGGFNAYLLFYEKNSSSNSKIPDISLNKLPPNIQESVNKSNSRFLLFKSVTSTQSIEFFALIQNNEIKEAFFFNVLCELGCLKSIKYFSKYLVGINSKAKNDTENFLRILCNLQKSSNKLNCARKSIAKVFTKDADLECFQILFSNYSIIQNNPILSLCIGKLFNSYVKLNIKLMSEKNHQNNLNSLFDMTLKFIIRFIEIVDDNRTWKNFDFSYFFDGLIYCKTIQYDISPIFLIANKLIFNRNHLIRFLRMLCLNGLSTNDIVSKLYSYENAKIILSYLPIAHLIIPNFSDDSIGNYNIEMNLSTYDILKQLNMLLSETNSKSFLIKNLKYNFQLLFEILINDNDNYGLKIIQKIFAKKKKSSSIKFRKSIYIFSNFLLSKFGYIVNKTQEQDISTVSFFKVLFWLFNNNICDQYDLYESNHNILNMISEIIFHYSNANYSYNSSNILSIGHLLKFIPSPQLLILAFNGFFQTIQESTLHIKLITKVIKTFFQQISNLENIDIDSFFSIVKSEVFIYFCIISIQKYKENNQHESILSQLLNFLFYLEKKYPELMELYNNSSLIL